MSNLKQQPNTAKPIKSLEAEQSALGAMLSDQDAARRGGEMLKLSDFENTANKRVFEAFLAVLQSSAELNFITAIEQLRESGETSIDIEYLRALVEACPRHSVGGLESYATRLRELSERRRSIETADALRELAESGEAADYTRALASAAEHQARAIELARPRFKPLTLAEIEAQEPQADFIEGIAPSGCLFGLVGPFGSGKSFLALDWALCCATGQDWQGREVASGAVIYITPEGTQAFGKRSLAWRIARGNECDPVPIPSNFYLIPEAPLLMMPGDVEELLRVIKSLAEIPALIVVDTVARHMTGGDENSQRDMGLFIAGADRLRTATGATLLLVHHTGKDGKMRGSTALPGALDAFAEVTKPAEKTLKLTSGKTKDTAPFEPMGFEARVVELGTVDKSGNPLTSLVFDLDPSGPAEPMLSPRAEQLLNLLPENESGTSYSDWKRAAVEAGIPEGSFDALKLKLRALIEQDKLSRRYKKRANHQPSNNHQTTIMMVPAIPDSHLPSLPSHPFRGDGNDGDGDGSGEVSQKKSKRRGKNSAESEPYKAD